MKTNSEATILQQSPVVRAESELWSSPLQHGHRQIVEDRQASSTGVVMAPMGELRPSRPSQRLRTSVHHDWSRVLRVLVVPSARPHRLNDVFPGTASNSRSRTAEASVAASKAFEKKARKERGTVARPRRCMGPKHAAVHHAGICSALIRTVGLDKHAINVVCGRCWR